MLGEYMPIAEAEMNNLGLCSAVSWLIASTIFLVESIRLRRISFLLRAVHRQRIGAPARLMTTSVSLNSYYSMTASFK